MTAPGGTSGTYSFQPSVGELTLWAFNRCGIRPAALTHEHMQDAHMTANLLALEWSAKTGVNLWTVDLFTTPLVQGVATYPVDPKVIAVLDLYVTIPNTGQPIDRYILPISRTEYASYSQKQQQGFPTTYWFDRLLAPTITFWPVPDGQATSFSYYGFTQIQDLEFKSGQQAAMNSYALPAFAAGLAAKLAVAWASDKVQMLKAEAMESYTIFADQNTETSNVYITPSLSGYWRT